MKRAKNKSKKPMNKKAKKNIKAKPEKPTVKLMKDLQRLAQLLQVHQIELEHQNQELIAKYRAAKDVRICFPWNS